MFPSYRSSQQLPQGCVIILPIELSPHVSLLSHSLCRELRLLFERSETNRRVAPLVFFKFSKNLKNHLNPIRTASLGPYRRSELG